MPFNKRRDRMFGTSRGPGLGVYMAGILVLIALVLGGLWLFRHFPAGLSMVVPAKDNAAEVQKARQLAAQGQPDEARAILEPIARKDDPAAPSALLLLAEIEQTRGGVQAAIDVLERARKEHPATAEQPQVLTAYACLLEQAGRFEDAVRAYESVRDMAAAEARVPALVGLGRHAERNNDTKAARTLYAQALRESAWNGGPWNEALDGLGRVNIQVIFSPAATPESKVYSVQSGDNLTGIGMKLNTTIGMLCRANGITESTKLWPGQQLKYTPKDFQITIERSTCRLFLFDKDGLFKRYYTGLGEEGHETTLGAYKIGNKEKDPTWHKRGEAPIPAGDPRNELGTRWLPLIPVEEGLPQDLGIHGTPKPETVGTYVSQGCARMRSEDVEELYDLVVRSTPVNIVETIESFPAPS